MAEKVRLNAEYYTRRGVRALRSIAWSISSKAADRPIIVVGCSRAGTTVVYKVLSESRGIGTLQRETHDLWAGMHAPSEKNWETHGLGAADASAYDCRFVTRYFYSWTGRHRWVDKNNQNGLRVPYLRALFPDAVFVFVKRSPGDNINSLIEGWSKPDEFATWSLALPARVAIDGGRYRRWCFFLAPGWRQYLTAPIESVAAFQYESINRAIIDARAAIPAAQWIEIFYEDLVHTPVATFRNVLHRCGLVFDSRLETYCSQVLETPFNAFSAIRLDKWRNGPNRDRVERVLPVVAEIATALGYTGI